MFSFLLTVFFCGCEKDDFNRYIPNDAVVASFVTKFPTARNVTWDMKGGYDVADFTNNGRETEAWFMSSGEWMMTNSAFLYEDLPYSVQRAQRTGDYAECLCDAVRLLERSGMATVYVIETEKGGQETDLFYSTSGLLVRAEKEQNLQNYVPVLIPRSIETFVADRYPEAVVAGYRIEGGEIEVDVVENDWVRVLLFDQGMKWISTQYEVAVTSVPACVMEAFRSSSFSGGIVDRVDYRKAGTATGIYLFDVKSGGQFASLAIDEKGRLCNR